MALPEPENMPIALPGTVGGHEPGSIVSLAEEAEQSGLPQIPLPSSLPRSRRRRRSGRTDRDQTLFSDKEVFSPSVLEISDTELKRRIDDLAAQYAAHEALVREWTESVVADGGGDHYADGGVESQTPPPLSAEEFAAQTLRERLELQRIFIGLLAYSGTCLRGLPHLTYALGLDVLPDSVKNPLVAQWALACFQNAHVARLLLTDERAGTILRWLDATEGPYLPALAAVELLSHNLYTLQPPVIDAASKEVIAATTDESLVWMLQRLLPAVGAPASPKQSNAVQRLRQWLVMGTHEEASFGGRVMPMTKTKQFLAPYFRRINLADFQKLAREQAAAKCTEMQQPGNARCLNEEGTLGGNTWCDTPAWTYFRDVDGYCYDIRELLTQLGQNDPYLPEPQPVYAFTRRPIEPTDIYNWAVKATERGWVVPANIARMLAAYALSGPAANVQRPYGRYYQLADIHRFLENDVLNKRQEGEFFNPSTPEAYSDAYPSPEQQAQRLRREAEDEELPEASPVLTRGVQQVVYRGPLLSSPGPVLSHVATPFPPASVSYHRRRVSRGAGTSGRILR